MAGRRRKREPVVVEVINRDGCKKAKEENNKWSELPSDLLIQILSCLEAEDNIRVSAVCKNWNETATSVRVVDQPPWLIRFPTTNNLYEFYDPSRRKTHILELPELAGSKVCYSKEGWLLMCKPIETSISDNGENTQKCVFFYNPFTRELINLPILKEPSQLFVFSCSPTSKLCNVCAISYLDESHVIISTCRVRSPQWTIRTFANFYGSRGRQWKSIITFNNYLYCLASSGYLCRIDMCRRVWNILDLSTPSYEDHRESGIGRNWKPKIMAEHEGNLYLMYTGGGSAAMFRLEAGRMDWEYVDDRMNGITIFASPLSSTIRTNLPGKTKNRVYFSKLRYHGRRCLSYKVDERRYYPSRQSNDWSLESPSESIWIDPPENVKDLF